MLRRFNFPFYVKTFFETSIVCKFFFLAPFLITAAHAGPAVMRVGEPRHTYTLPGRPAEPAAADDLDGRLSSEVREGQTILRVKLAPGEATWGAGQRPDEFN